MEESRNRILERLRRHLRHVEHPTPWRSRRHFDDLAKRFHEALTAAGGEVHMVATVEEARATLQSLLSHLGAKEIVMNDEPLLRAAGLPLENGSSWHVVGESEATPWRQVCAQADVGITACQAALAETGSVAMTSGPGQSRLVSLLPPVHIALVPHHALTTDIFTWAAEQRPAQMPANLVFVSGPSKTADIEQTLAVGVHGPKRFIVLLIAHMPRIP